MVDIQKWLGRYEETMRKTFRDRIVFIGLQGSYGRGEATPESDIDVALILDELTPGDLAAYDAGLAGLPHRELVCGFVSGKRELQCWEKADLFQFCMDTAAVTGSLEEFMPEVNRESAARAAHQGACAVYHSCVHNMLHEKDGALLKALYKSAVFAIQADLYARTGRYVRKSAGLLEAVSGRSREVLRAKTALREKEFFPPEGVQEYSAVLLLWAQETIQQYGTFFREA